MPDNQGKADFDYPKVGFQHRRTSKDAKEENGRKRIKKRYIVPGYIRNVVCTVLQFVRNVADQPFSLLQADGKSNIDTLCSSAISVELHLVPSCALYDSGMLRLSEECRLVCAMICL